MLFFIGIEPSTQFLLRRIGLLRHFSIVGIINLVIEGTSEFRDPAFAGGFEINEVTNLYATLSLVIEFLENPSNQPMVAYLYIILGNTQLET